MEKKIMLSDYELSSIGIFLEEAAKGHSKEFIKKEIQPLIDKIRNAYYDRR